MIKPRDYDTTEAKISGAGFGKPAPAPGGHGCAILKAELEKDDYGEKLVLYIEVKEGSEFDNYYTQLYNYKKGFDSNAKWPGIFRQPVYTRDGATNPFFKGLITSIENSNPGFKWNFDERTLNGKKVGLVFGEEEYKSKIDGSIRTTIRPSFACDYQNAADMPAPKKKLLNLNSAPAQTMTEAPMDSLPWDR